MRVWIAAVMVAFAVATPWAHEVTYKGTVIAVHPNPYAASEGVLATLEMRIANGGRAMSFAITLETRIWRGETAVSFSEARIRPNEPIAVTYTDEEPEKGAQEIRLPREQPA